jgi:hypothetical protein
LPARELIATAIAEIKRAEWIAAHRAIRSCCPTAFRADHGGLFNSVELVPTPALLPNVLENQAIFLRIFAALNLVC